MMPRRSYVSVARAEAAAEKKERVIQAAARFLREEESITGFSLDAVAKTADVTRLTVYNQFGSRRGLLEAVFDDIAVRGNLLRLNDALAEGDPQVGLGMLIEIFCEFWGSDPAVIRLHDAMAIDPEFAQALLARNERRRSSIAELVARIVGYRGPAAAQHDAVDMIFALTSCAMFRMLVEKRPVPAVCALIKQAVRAAIAEIEPGSGHVR
jgi:AcrR family transcriptional regulator